MPLDRTWYNTLVDDDGTGTTGTFWDKAAVDALMTAVDALKLDQLAAPTDVTTLNATTSAHGLLPKLGGGSTNYLRADGTWATPGGGGTAGGSNTQVQFNDSSAFGGDAGLTYNKTTDELTVAGAIYLPGLTTSPAVSINTTGSTLTLANNATQTFSMSSGLLYIYDGSNGVAAFYAVTNSATAIIWQSGTLFTTTLTTAAKHNVGGSAGTITIENKTGGTVSYKTFTVRVS